MKSNKIIIEYTEITKMQLMLNRINIKYKNI